MARSNRFTNKKIDITNKSDSSPLNTFDTLPSFQLVDGILQEKIIKSNGSTGNILFNANEEVKTSNIPIKERKGLVVPSWFYKLYQFNPAIAIELARVLLKILNEKKFHSGIAKPFVNITEFVLKTEIDSLSNITLSLFDQMINDINYSRAQALCGDIQRVLSFCPTISKQVKAEIASYVYAEPVTKKEKKTFKERLANSKLNNDYSDYVMFQIYAYTNACLSDIEESYNNTLKFIQSEEYDSFFYESGAQKYKQWITDGNQDDFLKAFEMELADSYRVNLAVDKLRSRLDQSHKDNLIRNIQNSNYASVFFELPEPIKLESDVAFLCQHVLEKSLGNIVTYKNNFISKILADTNISIHSLYTKRIKCWKTKNFKDNYKLYSPWKHNQSFIYRAFYELNQNSKQTGETIHNVLLGRTNTSDFLLQQLLMANSGRNKEVVMSIPARVSGINILDNEDRFVSEKSIELIGSKTRGHHRVAKQQESLSIPVNTPIYRFLRVLDNVRAYQYPERQLFFLDTDVYKLWQKKFATRTEIKEKNGDLIYSIDSTKFRKVFTGEILYKYLEKISNKDDLIRAVASDLKNSIPLVYLLQSSTAETMVASAIVGLQIKFIDHHLQVAANLKINEDCSTNAVEKRFLCDCIDPKNPDYADNLNVDYCKQFDNCLGCTKAEVYREHLPNIIYRCFQYEQVLKINKDLYDTTYSLRHHRAKQVLDTFVSKATNGRQLHSDSFEVASSAWEDPNTYLLPPLLHSNA